MGTQVEPRIEGSIAGPLLGALAYGLIARPHLVDEEADE